MKKTIILILLITLIMGLSTVAFANPEDVFNQTGRFAKPGFVTKLETMGLSLIDWTMGLGMIGALFGLIFVSVTEYFGGLDQQKAKMWKGKIGFIIKLLFAILLAKNIIVFITANFF